VEQEKLKNIVEAALLAAHQPLTLPMLAALFQDTDAVSHEDLARAVETLGQACEGRGIELQEVASGFRYQVREDVHPWVSRLWAERQTKYSRALLETLALIAYRQPITRGEIEQVRGVAVATSIMRTLEEREWVRVVGYRDVPGKPALFGTTRQFLDYFNLKSLDQLPTLAEIREIADPDPQLALASSRDDAGNPPDAPSDPSDGTDEPAGADAPADAPRTTEDAA
jgi:segregation and condensation protein B